uniref:Uncharacterized protein n=1 Tax=Abalone asfa-like virus TaxID=2839893 RepID=A0A5K7Y105_9VIRU|nr:hypothetical protein [Abalone asfa-like virus]BCY04642.1 hypothetical protein [Abalone asfa-like virus]
MGGIIVYIQSAFANSDQEIYEDDKKVLACAIQEINNNQEICINFNGYSQLLKDYIEKIPIYEDAYELKLLWNKKKPISISEARFIVRYTFTLLDKNKVSYVSKYRNMICNIPAYRFINRNYNDFYDDRVGECFVEQYKKQKHKCFVYPRYV